MPRLLKRPPSLILVCLAAAQLSPLAAGAAKQDANSPLIKVGEYRLEQARQGATCAVLGESIFVFGGAAGKGVTHVERLDTRTGTVTRAPGEVIIRRYHAAIEHAGMIYLFGGEGYTVGRQAFEKTVEIYDPKTGTVTRGPDMPEPKSGIAAAKLGTKAYLIGGTKQKPGGLAQTNETAIFDFTTGAWSSGVPMPTPREARAEVVSGFILVVGGYSSRRAVADVEMFVPQENRWKALPALDRPVSAHSLAFLGSHLYLFGDYSDLGSTMSYDLRTRKSEGIRAGFRGVRHTCSAVVGDRIYVIGGNVTEVTGDEEDRIQVFALNPASAST